ncbi:hypothetical protein GBA52_021633 [Prunus armeniaca]|nr:hypothetical protein GBA52_021633 [Prunus armeniaca]
MSIRITEIHSIFELVEAILEHSKPKQKPHQNHHQYQTSAQHANSAWTAAHLCFPLSASNLFFSGISDPKKGFAV